MTTRELFRATILDEETRFTLHEVCEFCSIRESAVIEMVEEGITEPLDATAATLEFSGVAVTRLMMACRLQRDLHVNLAGAALALELLDEIRALEGRR